MAELNKTKLVNEPDNDVEYIDISSLLMDLFLILKKKFILLAITLVLCTGATYGYAKVKIPKTYSSTASIFLTPYISVAGIVDSSSQASNEKLLNNVMKLMTEDNIMLEVAKECGLSSASSVRNCLSVRNEQNTTLLRVTATSMNPKMAKKIVNTTVSTFISKMKENLNLRNIEIVSKGKVNYNPVGPDMKKYVKYGLAAGVGLDGLYVLYLLLTDNRIKSKKQAEDYFRIPVFCEFPELDEE
ncbi:MAG: Wzz/FepE/Etk N-terminal domain-containing protein [Bacillota bacterium]|nr:Wzz/FepE/Etk N-terminal domain-containing protein [Bacillota bacterium]